MATEEAKAAARAIYETHKTESMTMPCFGLPTEIYIQNLANGIDAEFAPVIKKAEKHDMALSTTAALQVENNELRKKRDDVKDVLKELVEATEELCDLMNGVRFEGYRPDSLTCQPANKALAAAEKLLEDK